MGGLAVLSITVLGCAGTWSSAESACSGYLVSDGTTRVWIDCGPGTLSALQHHVELAEIDALVVTHQHPDHCIELPVIRNAMVYGLGVERLPLYAPRSVFSLLEMLVGARGISPSFTPKMIGDRSVAVVGTIRLEFSRTDHPVETLAVRADPVDGSSGAIVYSADTGPGWSLSRFGEGIDVAMVEATLLAGETGEAGTVHLTAAQAGADARASGVRTLVVTHVPPTGDVEAHRCEAEEAFGAPVHAAHPHDTFTVGAH
jgi:ribonuclease BN (tRNA processing enzyme)